MARKNKNHRYHDGPSIWGRIFKILGVLVLIALVLTGAWALTLLGPSRVRYDDPSNQPAGDIPKDISALIDRSRELERSFHDHERMSEITPEDLQNLREAIRLQQEYLVKTHDHNLADGNQRIDDMTDTLQSHETVPLRAQSIELEKQGAALEEKKNLEGAKALFQQAAELEDKIILEFPKSKQHVSATGRSVLLHRHVDYLTALPIDDDSLAAEVAARAALQRQDWAAALENFQKARDLQARLNHDFADQRFTDSARLEHLDQELVALRALPDHQRIEKNLADAKSADAARDYLHAAELYQDAQRQQRDLIANFPNSRFADPAVIAVIDALRQTALSQPVAAEIKAQAATVEDDLRHRRIEPARNRVAALVLKGEYFRENYPRSSLLDDDLQQRLQYLNFKRDNLGSIQEQVSGQLLAVPGQTRFLLYKQEVPQSLYLTIAGGNPSRNQGPNLPVDSVNWTEAQEFCRHLSWVLGRPVRLPTTAEFRAALGSTDAFDPMSASWNLDNSSGKTQDVATKKPNANGFYDLLGNVAEWLERPNGFDEELSVVIGGNVQTPVDAIRAIATANIPIVTRNRFTGFRFVVDSNDSTPLLPETDANDAANAKSTNPASK